jgi:hypothetical protein
MTFYGLKDDNGNRLPCPVKAPLPTIKKLLNIYQMNVIKTSLCKDELCTAAIIPLRVMNDFLSFFILFNLLYGLSGVEPRFN